MIFLRGAMDPIHAFYPAGDTSIPAQRMTLQLAASELLPLAGSLDGFAKAHRNWAPLVTAGGPDADGQLAILYQVGNPLSRRSHFTEQQILETADVPSGFKLNTEGFVARLAEVGGFFPDLPAVSSQYKFQGFLKQRRIGEV